MANYRLFFVYFVDFLVIGYHQHKHNRFLQNYVAKHLLQSTYLLFLKRINLQYLLSFLLLLSVFSELFLSIQLR